MRKFARTGVTLAAVVAVVAGLWMLTFRMAGDGGVVINAGTVAQLESPQRPELVEFFHPL